MYDYLVVGAGLFGSVFAQQKVAQGKSVLVVEKRNHIGGNCYTEKDCGIEVHIYGPHIFHTNNKTVWDYCNQFGELKPFINSPVANSGGKLYNLPFNMNTFVQLFGITTPEEAKNIISEEIKKENIVSPKNLEEQALSLVGRTIFEKLIKGYTEKQWGRDCKELPPDIIKRLPLRFTFDNNYYNSIYQGIPSQGYTQLIQNMLKGVEVHTSTDYLENKKLLNDLASKVVYTGTIDSYYDFWFGALDYRTVYFRSKVINTPNFQGNAVVNYTDREVPFTRMIEHKWFNPVETDVTIVTKEYSKEYAAGDEPYYPVNDEKNSIRYNKYKTLADKETKIVFGGRLGDYAYYDMDVTIANALTLANKI